MRKYIVLFLLWGVFGNAQYNLFARQNFAKSVSVPTFNTYIGGVSGTIATSSALATKLGISVGAISNFTVVGSDIKCKITGSYAMNSWSDNTAITYIKDTDNLVTNTPQFDNCTNMSGVVKFITPTTNGVSYLVTNSNIDAILLPNVTSVYTQAFFENTSKIRDYYIPRCTNLGGSSADNSVFFGINSGSTIYCDPSLATNNGGNPDGDLQYAINRGVRVSYVQNFSLPNTPVLSFGNIYDTSLQITNSAGASTNSVDFYNIYNNGIYIGKSINGYIVGLTPSTSYNISVEAVDIYRNISPISNTVTQSTNTTATPYPLEKIISSWRMENNLLDYYKGSNGYGTAITYASGLVGQTAVFNGTTSKIDFNNNTAFQLSNGSIVAVVNTSAAGSSFRGIVVKSNAYSLFLDSGVLVTYSWGAPVGAKSTGINLNDGLNHIIVMTFQSGVTNGTKIYLDGTLVLTTTMSVNSQGNVLQVGANITAQQLNGEIDEVTIFSSVLTASEVTAITSMLNSGNSL